MGVQYPQIIYNPTILLKLMVTWGFPTKKKLWDINGQYLTTFSMFLRVILLEHGQFERFFIR